MNAIIQAVLLKVTPAGGLAVSKTKVTAILGAVINLLQVSGVLSLTPAQWESVNTLLAALVLLFIRDGINDSAPKV
jgi:hypothetical protein